MVVCTSKGEKLRKKAVMCLILPAGPLFFSEIEVLQQLLDDFKSTTYLDHRT